jgi:hypothetical protein
MWGQEPALLVWLMWVDMRMVRIVVLDFLLGKVLAHVGGWVGGAGNVAVLWISNSTYLFMYLLNSQKDPSMFHPLKTRVLDF